MQVPNLPNGNLYQNMTVIGAFIVIVSCYSIANVFESHDAKLRAAIEHVLIADQAKPEIRQFWMSYLEARKKDVEFLLSALLVTGVFGLGVTSVGIWHWYYKVQKFEDEKRKLENQQLGHAVNEQLGHKKLYTGQDNGLAA